MLQRKDSIELGSTTSMGSSEGGAHKPTVVERLEGFFTQDLPTTMDVLPTDEKPSSAPRTDIAAKPQKSMSEPKGAEIKGPEAAPETKELAMPSEFLVVRSIRQATKEAIARTRDAYGEIDDGLQKRAKEIQERQEALSTAVDTVTGSLTGLRAKLIMDLAQELEKAAQAVLDRSNEQLQQQADAAVAALNEKLGSEKQRFVAETEKQFEELRASRQAFINDSLKQLTAVVGSSLDSLAQAATQKARAELDASKQGVLAESQQELASTSRAAIEPLSKELTKTVVDEATAALAASRQASIHDSQQKLVEMVRASTASLQSAANASIEQAGSALAASRKQFVEEIPKQVAAATQSSLESVAKNAVDRGRKDLSHMVDEFLGKSIPQIEAELEKLVSRHTEAIRSQATQVVQGAPPLYTPPSVRTQSVEAPRPGSVRAVPSPRNPLEFTLAESAPKSRVDLREAWTGVAWGLKLGLAAVTVALVMFAVYISSSPVIRLRIKPPTAFLNEESGLTAKQRVREDQLAHSYWDIAVRDIETKYGFGTALPADPPDSFSVQEKGPANNTKVDAAARTYYWGKLRTVWSEADSWERASDWNLGWIRNAWNVTASKVARVFGVSDASATAAR